MDYERWIHREKRIEDKLSELDNKTEGLRDIFKKFGGGVSGGSGLIANPEKFISGKLLDVLGKAGPHGAVITAFITAVAAAPEVARGVIMLLAQKGGPLNNDFRVIVEEEVVGFLSLSDQHKRQIGIDGFVVSQVGGFNTIDGTDVTNSRLEADEIRITRVPQGVK